MTEYYNLDVIISVGYRVKSKRGVEFRRWANSVLKQYILKGYAVNDNRIRQLGEVIRIMKRTENELDSRQVLSVIEKYSSALDLLDSYDHQNMTRPEGNRATYVLTYEECMDVIQSMRFGDESDLFGKEKDDSFKGSIGNIYQSFGGTDIYESLEEKAANLLYLVTKNHSFFDGNKRIAATMFLYFLDKNEVLIYRWTKENRRCCFSSTNHYDRRVQTRRKRNDDKRDYELYVIKLDFNFGILFLMTITHERQSPRSRAGMDFGSLPA